jgi:hypothetical protein
MNRLEKFATLDKAAFRLSRLFAWLGALLGNMLRPRAGSPYSSVQLFLSHHPLLYAQLLEVHSLLGHMHTSCDTRMYRRGVDLGPLFETLPDESVRWCKETLNRKSGTRRLQEVFPWASPVDLQIFLLGWNTAVATLACTSDNGQQSAISYLSPDSLPNSGLLSASQSQKSKTK